MNLGGLGWMEISIILLVLVILFGAKRIPELAKSLGQAKREFHKGITDGEENRSSKPTDRKSS
jgi:sec-independent protein translocase protein TatA